MVSEEALRQRLLSGRLIAARIIWETADTPAKVVEAQLERQYKSCEPGEHHWRGTFRRYWVFTWTVTLTNEGQVHVTRELPGWVRVILLAGVLITPFLMLTNPVSLMSGGLALMTYIMGPTKYNDPPVASCTSIVTDSTPPLTRGDTVMIFSGIVAFTLQDFSSAFGLIIAALVLVMLAAIWYVENGFPGGGTKTKRSRLVLTIPVTMAFPLFSTLFLSFITALVAGQFTVLTDDPRATATTAPSGRSFLAGTYDWAGITEAQHGFLTLFGYFLPVFFGVLLFTFLLWISSAADTRNELANTRLEPFASGRQRWLATSLLGGLNLILIGGALVGICVVAYGLTGTLYSPVYVLGDLAQLIPAGLELSTREMVNGLYQALAYNLRKLPWLSPRGWSVVVVALWLWPIIFIVMGTVLGVVGRPYRAVAALARSKRLPASDGQHLLSNDIQIRTIDLGGMPDAKPMTLLGGWRQYVFVSEVLVNELSGNEFEAVLRHEEYHLQESNRSVLAELLSPLVGGKNALLAFYDYRASERAADDYAAHHTSYRSTHDAVEEMYKLAVVANNTAGRIGIDHPGIIQREPAQELLSSLRDGSRLRRLFQAFMRELNATYDLYFGATLLETAHLDPEARLARLRERAA